MKWFRPLFVVLVLLVTLQAAKGQSRMRFSVHADPQFAWLNSSDDSIAPDGSIFNIQAGLQMENYFQENYAFYVGFGINNMGGNLLYNRSEDYISGDDDTITINGGQSVKMNLQYLDIPLGLKLKTEELGYATFFLQIGFNPMFNINAHITTSDGEVDNDDIPNSVNTFHLGYHVGAGAEYRLGGSTSAIGGIRWSSGFGNVTKNDGSTITLNAISIHLGILF
jgi:hypothetical protein